MYKATHRRTFIKKKKKTRARSYPTHLVLSHYHNASFLVPNTHSFLSSLQKHTVVSEKKQRAMSKMALTIEIMGGRLIDGPSKMSMSRGLGMAKKSEFLASPVLVPSQGRRRQERVRRAVKGPVAAIREDIIKANSYTSLPEKAVRFKVRALVTVRNKHREDLKETIVKHLDALTDNIGRNVVLQLISTEVDPSK